uniref:Beta/gamma crystallin 'Greek key' domain-containing protein n=1 Tax=Anolis carolinensis TaxID=28377 RepID=H9GPN0_ANOCA
MFLTYEAPICFVPHPSSDFVFQLQPQEESKPVKKVNVRPGKIILYSESGFGGQKREIWANRCLTCWKLYHKGLCLYKQLSNGGNVFPFQDYKLPEISLFSEENGEGTKQRFTDSSEDTRMYSKPLKAASIIVYSGLWLVYSKPYFDDDPYVLEPGGYPSLQAWGAKDSSVCSIHPIKLGCPVVEKAGEPKLVIYEKPHFQGRSWEVSRDIYNVSKPENSQDCKIPTVGSLKIMGGCWVGYEKEGFRGHQYLLEEGEYNDWNQWGGYNDRLMSLRLIRTDFLDPALVLFEAMDFEEGPSIELISLVESLQAEGFNNHVLSVRVKGGIWVLCEHNDFRGRQWLLNCMEITNWLTYSGLQHIGSLYPIRQKRIYFRLRNEDLDTFLSVPDDVEDMKAGRVLVSELRDSSSSIWYYEDGLLKNQVAPNMSLQVIGPAGSGSKVVLWSESRVPQQTWQIDSYGRICSQMFEDKVVDVKGGNAYDHDHAILWDSSEDRPTQIWHVEVL